eukprot:818068-Amphidinium_carterae.1
MLPHGSGLHCQIISFGLLPKRCFEQATCSTRQSRVISMRKANTRTSNILCSLPAARRDKPQSWFDMPRGVDLADYTMQGTQVVNFAKVHITAVYKQRMLEVAFFSTFEGC